MANILLIDDANTIRKVCAHILTQSGHLVRTAASAEEGIRDIVDSGAPDLIITDPPRAGMDEKVVQMLLRIAAPVIVYVSCNPATQARDHALMDERYSVEQIQPVDMFPQTYHVENVVRLTLKP